MQGFPFQTRRSRVKTAETEQRGAKNPTGPSGRIRLVRWGVKQSFPSHLCPISCNGTATESSPGNGHSSKGHSSVEEKRSCRGKRGISPETVRPGRAKYPSLASAASPSFGFPADEEARRKATLPTAKRSWLLFQTDKKSGCKGHAIAMRLLVPGRRETEKQG